MTMSDKDNGREPDVDAVLRRLARMVWIEVGKARNPLLNQALSSGQDDRLVNDRGVERCAAGAGPRPVSRRVQRRRTGPGAHQQGSRLSRVVGGTVLIS